MDCEINGKTHEKKGGGGGGGGTRNARCDNQHTVPDSQAVLELPHLHLEPSDTRELHLGLPARQLRYCRDLQLSAKWQYLAILRLC